MSSDPRRWLAADGEATPEEVALLQSCGDAEPPAGAREAAWALLAAKLPPDGGGGNGGGNGGSAAGTSAATKAVIGVLLASAIAAIVVFAARSPDRPSVPPPAVSIATPATAPTPSAVATVEDSLPSIPVGSLPGAPPAITAKPSAAAATPRPAELAAASGTASPIDALLDERALLAAARDAHRRGDDRTALATLATARERHPSGVLGQEREVLAIEALAQLGDRDAASSRGKAFLEAFPTSPHASHVRELVR